MPDASFLDTGVVLGFCFRDDAHHHRCRRYLDDHDFRLFVSDHVVSEYLNRETLMEEVEVWERDEEYSTIDDELSAIPWDDRRICLDAHDVVVVTGLPTELATTNPTDLVGDGYRELILDATSIEDVVSLASRSLSR